MLKYITLVALFTLSFFTVAESSLGHTPSGSRIEALTQAGHRLSYILDTKTYAALDSVLTHDVVLDATELQPLTGGVTNGFDETVATFKRSGDGAKTAHRITNILLLDEITPEKARVSS